MLIDLLQAEPQVLVHNRPGELSVIYATNKGSDPGYIARIPGVEGVTERGDGTRVVQVRPPLYGSEAMRNEHWILDCTIHRNGVAAVREYSIQVMGACTPHARVQLKYDSFEIRFHCDPFVPWDGRAVIPGPEVPTLYDRLLKADSISETRM